jgi:hypothetical protein
MMSNMDNTTPTKFIVDEFDPMAEAERHAMLQGHVVTNFAPDKPSPNQPRIRNRREKRANLARNRRKGKPSKRRH